MKWKYITSVIKYFTNSLSFLRNISPEWIKKEKVLYYKDWKQQSRTSHFVTRKFITTLCLSADCLSKPNQSFETSYKVAASPPYEYTHEEDHSKCFKYCQVFMWFFSLTMTICSDCTLSILLKTGITCIK